MILQTELHLRAKQIKFKTTHRLWDVKKMFQSKLGFLKLPDVYQSQCTEAFFSFHFNENAAAEAGNRNPNLALYSSRPHFLKSDKKAEGESHAASRT